MKTELRPRPHTQIRGAVVVEVWWGEEFVGTITGADKPGVRFQSKHEITVNAAGGEIKVIELETLLPSRQ